MVTTDPIADLLARIRNGLMARKMFVLVSDSKMNRAIAEILKTQGYIIDVTDATTNKGRKPALQQLKITLKYVEGRPMITYLQRVSRPGQRIYLPINRLKSVLRGVGVAVVSTSKGLMTDKQARNENIGGEVLFKVW